MPSTQTTRSTKGLADTILIMALAALGAIYIIIEKQKSEYVTTTTTTTT
jgi:hypothetical protein